ncbi:MAG: hypothetical protein KBS96_05060 [Lachnospiraceae bacterium]|nr:hypothetical protein [Candidatus Colinaster scatohippi]
MSFCMTGCITVGKSASEKKAKEDVEEIFGYELKLTDSMVEQSQHKKYKKNYYYEFEDANGMQFTYASTIEPEGLDGATFFYQYCNEINYRKRVVPFYSQRMKEICDEYEKEFLMPEYRDEDAGFHQDVFGNRTEYGGATILVHNVEELRDVAAILDTILNECQIHRLKSSKVMQSVGNMEIAIAVHKDETHNTRFSVFQLLYEGETLDKDSIYGKLFKEYIESVKKGHIPNDLDDGTLSRVCPEILHGIYQDKDYPLWTAGLIDDSDSDNPKYEFEMLYREPSEREKYEYHGGYYAEDLQIQNFIAVLGGSCSFCEAQVDGDSAGFTAYLGDDSYFFGFINDKSQVLIRKNDEEYFFDLSMKNPAMDEYLYKISREDVEKIFGVTIEIQKETSNFYVKKN